MRRLYFILMSLCALVVHPHPLHAQVTTDTAGFRAGEWGVGLVQGRAPTEGGVFRFSTPTRAWVLDGWAVYDRQVFPGAGIFGTDQSTQTLTMNASIGPRWYRNASGRLVRFVGAGVLAGYSGIHSSENPGHATIWSAGGYGEVGVLYMFSRHFGLGWRGTVLGSRSEDHQTQDNGAGGTITQQSTHYEVSVQPVQVMGTIHF